MHNNQRGITLIEILAGMTILIMLVFIVLNISTFNIKTQGSSDKFSTATVIAEKELNIIRNKIKENTNYVIASYTPSFYSSPTNYTVIIQNDIPIPLNGTSPIYNNIPNKRHVSMQSIVYRNNSPRLLTVTVSWSD